MSLPRDVLRAQLLRLSPEMGEAELDETLEGFQLIKENDPLAVLQETGEEKRRAQLTSMKLAQNFGDLRCIWRKQQAQA